MTGSANGGTKKQVNPLRSDSSTAQLTSPTLDITLISFQDLGVIGSKIYSLRRLSRRAPTPNTLRAPEHCQETVKTSKK